jgi:hypothetical protein
MLYISGTEVSRTEIARFNRLSGFHLLTIGPKEEIAAMTIEDAGGQLTLDDGTPTAHVTGVNLESTRTGEAELQQIKSFPNLQRLNLSGTNTADTWLKHLECSTNLEMLSLIRTKTTDAGLKYLEGLANLQCLDLWGTQVTEDGVRRLQEALPNCTIRR